MPLTSDTRADKQPNLGNSQWRCSAPAEHVAADHPRITDLVKDVSGLVSPPDVCVRVFELMRASTSSAEDFGEIIGRDPNLTTRLLRMVNSSFYGFASRIDTVSRAIAVIGTQELYALVISVSAVQSFSKIAPQQVDMSSFWRHSVCCGLIARRLSRHCGVLHPERLFIAGLLHEVGTLVLFHQLPELSAELVEACEGDEDSLHRAELDTLGYSHAEVGSLLLTLWSLPLHCTAQSEVIMIPPTLWLARWMPLSSKPPIVWPIKASTGLYSAVARTPRNPVRRTGN